jgi:hypothetical protein
VRGGDRGYGEDEKTFSGIDHCKAYEGNKVAGFGSQ